MKNFTSIEDINDLQAIIKEALQIKENPLTEQTEPYQHDGKFEDK